jgi:hypothetical protein
MSRTRLSVSVDDARLNRVSEVARALEKAGLKVEEELATIGVITGEIDDAKVDDVHRVEGVAHVEAEREVRIAPPESDIQ